ncbi:hypothetical protein RUM43_001229, partial [Polyplax serrata]
MDLNPEKTIRLLYQAKAQKTRTFNKKSDFVNDVRLISGIPQIKTKFVLFILREAKKISLKKHGTEREY